MPHDYSEGVSTAVTLSGRLTIRSPGKIMTAAVWVWRLCLVLEEKACSLGLTLLHKGRPMH